MVLIVGSKSETKALCDLIYEAEHDLKKHYGGQEVFAIRAWLEKQPHLPYLSDDQIILFLNSRQFRIERTKKAIEDYFTMRTQASDLFTKRNVKILSDRNLNPVCYAPLPPDQQTYAGHHIIGLGLFHSDWTQYNITAMVKACTAMFDLQVGKAPLAKGYEFVFDANNLQMGHLARLSLPIIKRSMLYLQRGLPGRVKAFHVISTSPFTQQAVELVRPFLKPHLLSRIHIYHPSKLQSLIENYVPKSILPSDFGGDGASLETLHCNMMKEMQLARCWLEEIEEMKVDESKRVGSPIISGDIFGMEGSFKKLSLD